MSDKSRETHFKFWMSAFYRIEVKGYLDENMSHRLGGLRISTHQREDLTAVATLSGRVRDQTELTDILNNLYEMHLPILSVENLFDEQGNAHGEDP